MSSPYPWRRVMNASYCSLADIRHSFPPPPSSTPLSPSHVPFPLLLRPLSLSVLPSVHSGSDMYTPPPTSLIFTVFHPNLFALISLLRRAASHLQFPPLPSCCHLSTFSPPPCSPTIATSYLELFIGASYPAPPSIYIPHSLNLC